MKKFRIVKFKKKPFFQVKKISKSFSNNLILNEISFSVSKGEIFGIFGPNGCGKTTIFNVILGILKAENGKIEINGEDINLYPVHERCKRWKVAMVPQNSACFLGLSVQKNIAGVCELKIQDRTKRKERVQELLAKFNLESRKNILARDLSGGEKKRLSISLALVTIPSLLLLDEPFSALDPLSVETIREIISDLQKNEISCIISDHNISSTLMSVDRAILLANSTVIAEGSPRALLTNPRAKALYFGTQLKI